MKKIAVFASGNGSNAENIIKYFEHNNTSIVDIVLTNNTTAKVIDRAKSLGVEVMVFSRNDFYSTAKVIEKLKTRKIDLLILAGFMWLVPSSLIQEYPSKIINIHPALLPKYGGKGMYGDFVHQAVSAAKEIQTGITIHYVNEKYDEGAIIAQKMVDILPGEDPDSIAKKVHTLEYKYYPVVIESSL